MADQKQNFEHIDVVKFEPSKQAKNNQASSRPRKWLLLIPLILAVTIIWYLFAMRSLYVEIRPDDASMTLDTLPYFYFNDYLFVLPGRYTLSASAANYKPLTTAIEVTDRNDSMLLQLAKKPGQITFTSIPAGATVWLATDEPLLLGGTPITAALEAGEQHARFELAKYKTQNLQFEVAGLEQSESFEVVLVPDWARVAIRSEPVGATLWENGAALGTTPNDFELLSGTRKLQLTHPGFLPVNTEVVVEAGKDFTLPLIRLAPVKAVLHVISDPAGASLLLGDRYLGKTPLSTKITPGTTYQLIVQKAGYRIYEQSISLASGEEKRLQLTMSAIQGKVTIEAIPADSIIAINGIDQSQGRAVLNLPAVEQQLTIRRAGYATHVAKVTPTPGKRQTIKVRLITEAQAARAALLEVYQNGLGQSFQLIKAGLVQMGASRNERDFQRNQIKREVRLLADFYLALKEVSNAEYRRFMPSHHSRTEGRVDLDPDAHPVVQVAWLDAVKYCNWSSKKEGLTPAYRLSADGSKAELQAKANGYRLPTEAEWAWAARQPGALKKPLQFPWGNTNRPTRVVGNFGEKQTDTAYVLRSYKDGYLGTAPPGRFQANPLGIFDLGGNVSEWVQDYYHTEELTSWSGPTVGSHRTIRGSSWRHSSVKKLRLAYRRYGNEGQSDVGFRLARTP